MLEVHYYYIPPDVLENGENLKQTLVQVASEAKLSPEWNVAFDVAAAGNNFSKASRVGEFHGTGTGVQDNSYFLGKKKIIESSEQVFIGGVLQNADKDYYLNTVLGTLRFRNQTPTNKDVIDVYYEYMDESSQTKAGVEEFNVAYSAKTAYRGKYIQVNADVVGVEKDYFSLSPVKQGKGTNSIGADFNMNLYDQGAWKMRVKRYATYKGTEDKSTYLYQTDFSSSLGLKFFKNLVGINQRIERSDTEQPPYKGETNYESDSRTYRYSGRYNIGPDYWKTNLTHEFSRNSTDIRENENGVNTGATSLQLDSKLTLKDLWLLGDLSVSPLASTMVTDKRQQ